MACLSGFAWITDLNLFQKSLYDGHKVTILQLTILSPVALSECLYERFNRIYREDVLNMFLFSSLEQVRGTLRSA